MSKIEYISKKFRKYSLYTIQMCNEIIDEYQAQGFSLTLRQLYYQMVARDLIKNEQHEYKRLGSIVSDARNAGLIDWNAIEDRTRNLRGNTWYADPSAAVESVIRRYKIEKWSLQEYRPEVWIEKDALIGVIEQVCIKLDIDYFSCRGYVSASEMHKAGYGRFREYTQNGQTPVLIHLGDHDPSGMDMTRDIKERLELFSGGKIEVRRIALNYDQIERYNPPPNPTKLSDSRAKSYIKEYGSSSWELDALDPLTLAGLIQSEVEKWRDDSLWRRMLRREERGREELRNMIS